MQHIKWSQVYDGRHDRAALGRAVLELSPIRLIPSDARKTLVPGLPRSWDEALGEWLTLGAAGFIASVDGSP